MAPEQTNGWQWDAAGSKVWLGVAIGVAVGVGIVVARRKSANNNAFTTRAVDRISDFAEVTRDLVSRTKAIQQEALKVVQDAGQLWMHGRKLLGH